MSDWGVAYDDQDEESAVRSDKAVPVERLLAKIRQTIDGRILKVELDQEWRVGGRIWVYEAKILTADGRVLEVEYDARTLELLEFKGPQPKHRRRDAEE